MERPIEMQIETPAQLAGPLILSPEPLEPRQGPLIYPKPIGPAMPAYLIAKREAKRTELQTGGERVHLVGDKNALIVGYKENSLCNTLVADALQRSYLAMKLLDQKHADIIAARLAKAGVKNANASHHGSREVTFKKAVSIALQAERWVYQAQAAAAKSMAKQSKQCLHNLAGKRKRTTAEKDAMWAKTHGGQARPDRTARAALKLQKKIAKLGGK